MKITCSVIAAWLSIAGIPAIAASTSASKPIAVLDFRIEAKIGDLDNGAEINGKLTVYEQPALRLDQGTGRGCIDIPPLCSGNRLDVTDLRKPTISNVDIDLKVRGAGSATFPKKGYALDFKKKYFLPKANPEQSKNLPDTFLGMPRGREWVLHACWADATCLRDVIGYEQASRLFPWAPRTEFAEVFINGEYRGLYVVVEKITIEGTQLEEPFTRPRVNSPAPSASDKTGTYVLKQDQGDGDQDWTTYPPCTNPQIPDVPPGCHKDGLETPWWLVSPKLDEVTKAQRSYIQTLTNLVDLRPKTYIDQDSLANYIIMQEWSGNIDGYYRSMYFTKYPSAVDGALHMGPIWDLDGAFQNYYFCEGQREEWRIRKPQGDGLHGDGAGGRDPTFKPLYTIWASPQFRRLIQQRWATLRSNGVIEYDVTEQRGVSRLIALYAQRIKAAYARDHEKWVVEMGFTRPPITGHQCQIDDTKDAVAKLNNAVAILKTWISKRTEWMDKAFADPNFINHPD